MKWNNKTFYSIDNLPQYIKRDIVGKTYILGEIYPGDDRTQFIVDRRGNLLKVAQITDPNFPKENPKAYVYNCANSESKSSDDDVVANPDNLVFRNLLKDTTNRLGEVAKALASNPLVAAAFQIHIILDTLNRRVLNTVLILLLPATYLAYLHEIANEWTQQPICVYQLPSKKAG